MPSSIKSKLYLIILGATLPLVVLIVSLVWRDARHEAAEVRASALEIAEEVSGDLQRMAWQMETVLHTAQHLAALAGPDQDAVGPYLQRLPANGMPPVLRLSFLDDQGREVMALDGLGRPAPSFAAGAAGERRLDDLEAAHALAPLVVIGPYLEGPEGEPVILVSQRLSQVDGSAGTLVASVPVRHLVAMVQRQQLPPGSVVTIARTDGTIIARSLDHEDWIGRDLSSLQSFQDALTEERGTQVSNSIDGEERLAAYTRVDGMELFAYVGIPSAAAYAPLYGHVGTVIATAALIVLMVVLVAWWLASRIHRPLQRIGEGVAAFTAGQLDRRIAVEGPQELATLARDMNRMAGALQERQQELLKSRAALERSEQMLETIIDSEPACVKILDRSGRIVRVNAAGRLILSGDGSRVAGMTMAQLVSPQDQERFARHFEKVLLGETDRIEFQLRDLAGEAHTLESFAAPIRLATSESAEICYLAVSRDVTGDREAEERQRQSQRLTSIGKLTGGIAHDFNNLLTVIIGSVELLQERLEGQPDLARPLEDALGSAQRGAELTRRLLAFARRQPLQPRRLDLNRLVENMKELLTRTLGEQIEVRTRPSPELWPTVADPAQLESVLLNLALNARDAMPEGGSLTIETGNVAMDDTMVLDPFDFTAGDYVQLAVTDSGSGMGPEVLRRVFEPFFSTKGAGRGNGLGLSMAHGFAKQSGGQIRIYSEPGRGTTVRLYLPRATLQAQADRPEARSSGTEPGRGEAVLLVEDDAAVRELSANSLQQLGYRVTVAANAAEALPHLAGSEPFDLLFTDVVLPGGVDGVQLAERATALRPGLRVLFTSGYSESAILRGGRVVSGVQLISKPYRRDELSRRLRQALEQPAYRPVEA